MRGPGEECGSIAVVAPTLSTARAAARRLTQRGDDRRFVPFSLDRLLGSERATTSVALCPAGREVADDVRFLGEARARLLWPAPPKALRAAIAGLLGGTFDETLPRSSTRRRIPPGLLLEGNVTPRRARRALESDARIWIVERAGRVRLSRQELEHFSASGVRWFALQPVRVVAVIATPALARRRAGWRRLLPPRTPVWIWRRSPAAR